MFIDDNRACQSQTLPRTFSHFLGREKRIEYLGANALGNSGAGVCNRNDDAIAILPSAHSDAAFFAGLFDDVTDRVRGVDEQVEKHLVQVAQMAVDGRQSAQFGSHIGDVLDLIARNDQSAFDGFIQVGRSFFGAAIHVRELFHGANNGGDTIDTVQHLFEGLGNFRAEEVPLDVLADGVHLLQHAG